MISYYEILDNIGSFTDKIYNKNDNGIVDDSVLNRILFTLNDQSGKKGELINDD